MGTFCQVGFWTHTQNISTKSSTLFLKSLGGTIGLGIAEPIFASELSKYLVKYAPNAPAAIVKQSPTTIYTKLPAAQIPGVVRAYTASLKVVFLVGVPVGEYRNIQPCSNFGKVALTLVVTFFIAGLELLASLFIKNIKIEKHADTKGMDTKKDTKKSDETV